MNRRRALIALAMAGLFGLWAFPQFERARNNAISSSCQSNLKQIGLSIMQYVRDYDESYPPPRRWRLVLQPYIWGHKGQLIRLDILDCPIETTGYSYNFYLANAKYGTLQHVAAKTPLVFDSTDLSSQHYQLKTGPREDFRNISWTYRDFPQQKPDYGGSYPKDFHHLRGNNVLFADGHVALRTQTPVFSIK
jgi:prepilin-type processing-associated H-X9-DG protein